MSNYFTADLHLGHEKIIEYCERPFSCIEEMDFKLIQRINLTCVLSDDLYIIGDFALCGRRAETRKRIKNYLNQIYCNLHLIKGNHDRLKCGQYVDLGFKSARTFKMLGNWLLIHNHRSRWKRLPHHTLKLCGHSHAKNYDHTGHNCINIGVDAWNFKPVSEERINEIRLS